MLMTVIIRKNEKQIIKTKRKVSDGDANVLRKKYNCSKVIWI